jgi:predicted O-methyltransferase YrrM
MSDRGNDYAAETKLPQLVRRAADLAESLGFKNSCAVAYGRLLGTMAAQVRGGRIGEMGTGCGVGTAWMASSTVPQTRIVTIEADEERATAVAGLFSQVENVTALHGDSLDLGVHGPFDLLFCDGGGKTEDQAVTIAMVRPGGMIVLDDLTPGRSDGVREYWLEAPELEAVEIAVTPDLGAILAVRR